MTASEITRSPEAFRKEARERAYNYEREFHGCSQAVLQTFQELLDMKDDLLLKAAGPLCAGLGSGKSCGALAAGVLVLGMVHGRSRTEEGLGGLMKGFQVAQGLVTRFEQEFGSTVCREISGVDWTDPEQVNRFITSQEAEKCCRVAGKTAEIVADLLTEHGEQQ
jgi:C_GCAxxG_C_C family probable redox protein